jgi:transcriptional regulator with XRE-family HTH domain
MPMNILGKRLRELREKQSLSQKRAAEIFGISNFALSRYETGTANPDPDLIKKFAEYYEVTTDYLLGNSDIPNYKKPTLDDLDMKESENLFFFNRDGMSDEDIEKVKEYIELLRLKAKQHNEKHEK